MSLSIQQMFSSPSIKYKMLPYFLIPIRYSLLVEFYKLPKPSWKMLADTHVWLPMQLEKHNSTFNCMCMVMASSRLNKSISVAF